MAFQPSSPDLRDLYRPGGGPSRLTPRRLLVLVKALPPEAPLWAEVEAARQKALKPTAEQVRARAEYYKRKAVESE